MADDARRQLRHSHGGGSLDEVEPSRQLAGSRDLAATFAEQLDFSSRGATHTITIRAGALHDLLAALNRASSAETMLMHLPEPERANELLDGAAHRLWLMHLRELDRVRSQIDELADDALIHMPVRVEPVTGGSSLR